jgi:hypothetical protein
VVVDWEGYTIGTEARIIYVYVNSADQVMLHTFQGTTADRSRLETRLHSMAQAPFTILTMQMVNLHSSLQVKGGAFDNSESDNFRWVVGSGNAIGALDECVRYLHAVRSVL